MPFGTITANAKTFEPTRPGVYRRSGLAIGAATDEFRLTGASPSASSSKVLSFSVTRVVQKDFTPVGSTVPVRKNMIVTLNVQIPNDGSFTSAEADTASLEIDTFLTAAFAARLAAGEI